MVPKHILSMNIDANFIFNTLSDFYCRNALVGIETYELKAIWLFTAYENFIRKVATKVNNNNNSIDV